MVLTPDMGRQQKIERSNRLAPWHLGGGFQPFGVLIDHRIDDMDERLVTGQQAMAPRQQIAFEPTLAHLFAEDLHHPAID